MTSNGRCPNGRSLIRDCLRSYGLPPTSTPHRGQACSSATCMTTTRRPPGGISTQDTTRNPGKSNNNELPSLTGGLLHDRLRHRSAWEATPPSARYDTRRLTIHRGEPVYLIVG